MNKVIKSDQEFNAISPKPGDLYIDDDGDELYLLAIVDGGNKYAAISLTEGNRYCEPTNSPEDAVKKLIFYARDSIIHVDRK
jgi:hypothetical protein